MNPAGFDPSGLQDTIDPTRQSRLPGGYATQGQAVSAPYANAMEQAAMKNNPMNAVSQGAGVGIRVDDFIRRITGEGRKEDPSLKGRKRPTGEDTMHRSFPLNPSIFESPARPR